MVHIVNGQQEIVQNCIISYIFLKSFPKCQGHVSSSIKFPSQGYEVFLKRPDDKVGLYRLCAYHYVMLYVYSLVS